MLPKQLIIQNYIILIILRELRPSQAEYILASLETIGKNVNDLKHKGLNVRKVVGSGKLIEQFVRLEK